MTDYGIDLSHHNRVDDWTAVRRNNITCASVKLTGSAGFLDPAAGGHVGGARGAGVHVGGYHFARNTSVAAQVQHFAARIRALRLDTADAVAPMLDMEATELRTRANPFIAVFTVRMPSPFRHARLDLGSGTSTSRPSRRVVVEAAGRTPRRRRSRIPDRSRHDPPRWRRNRREGSAGLGARSGS